MSMSEFVEWQLFEAGEPFPAFRIDLGNAITASTIANINRGKNTQPFDVTDFMPVQQAKKRKERMHQLEEELGEAVDEEELILQRAFLVGSMLSGRN